MANRYLLPAFELVFEKHFSYSDFENRMEMQKMVYILQDMGVPIGDYGFRWYLHGPYSQSLQDDMFYESKNDCEKITWNKEYYKKICRLKDALNTPERGKCNVSTWIECLASLHYLKENVLCFGTTSEDIVNELEKRKEHMNCHATNLKAYNLVEGLFI